MVLYMLTNSILIPIDDYIIAQQLLIDLSSAVDIISHTINFTRLNDINVYIFIKNYITTLSYSVLMGK